MKMATGQRMIPERIVTEIWRRRLVANTKLFTTKGVSVKVIHPGDIEANCGPDFRQAVVCLDNGKPIAGDIEVHLRSSEWQSHKHHQDPAYNGVILHVVLWDDAKALTPLESGGSAPVVELAGLLPGSMEQVCQQLMTPWTAEEPCHRASKLLGADTIAGLLEAAGEERFRLKAALIEKGFESKGAEQALYEAVMSALGYSRNKQPFLKLAQSLPLEVLISLVVNEPPATRLLRLQALLLGAAGLLCGECSHHGYSKSAMRERDKLEELWSSAGLKQTMSQSEWCLSGIRPSNSPLRRIAAASHLIHRYLASGWLTAVPGLVLSAPISQRGLKEIEKGFLVSADTREVGLCNMSQKFLRMPPALLGPSRAAEIVVNVVLPFCFAWAQTTQQTELEKKALALYRSYAATGDNRIIRQMLQRIWQTKSSPVVDSAARQQGLIHVYLNFCLERHCTFCPLGSRVNPA